MEAISIYSLSEEAGIKAYKNILKNRNKRDERLLHSVKTIVEQVRIKGDKALFDYTKRFDGIELTAKNVRYDPAYISKQAAKAPQDFKKALKAAAQRIRAYSIKQKLKEFSIRTAEGKLAQRVIPLHKVGVYIPGGRSVYPSSVLMNVIPAQIAGVDRIIAVTPPRDSLEPVLAYALHYLQVNEVYRIGGAQAVAALAYGTESIPAVDKIVGPGNSFVALAKKLVYGAVDIDSIAGPSEVVVLADSRAKAQWISLDLLAQAEHGSGNETAILITEDKMLATAVKEFLHKELTICCNQGLSMQLSPKAISIFVSPGRSRSIEIINEIAPEHLQIMTRTPKKDLAAVRNAAAVFLGYWTPVAMGDYFIGTNHVLPTGGAARYASALGVADFVKIMSVAEVTKQGIRRAAPYVSCLARREHFIYHALSVERRVEKI